MDHKDAIANTPCVVTLGYRYPHVLEPETKQDEDFLVFPAPRHNLVDVVVSRLNLWSPSALQKLLDLSIPRFCWQMADESMKFYVERSWRHVQVISTDISLSYRIHENGLWQLLSSQFSKIDSWHPFRNTVDFATATEDIDVSKCRENEQGLARLMIDMFTWEPKRFRELDFHCWIMTKEGHHLNIDRLEATASNTTVADTGVPVTITRELAEIKEILQKTSEEFVASRKRKREGEQEGV
ncbi:hypothetical protein EYC80_005043 [Monilinia laxa]|uniref:Uncharacterized protein n=1 Tax=Monilinia laxa TaxID=61186 RepID=A0A5N6KKC9_MONLA|nr:hypothetical protein EYC80_005043 [Monilinia laxa]